MGASQLLFVAETFTDYGRALHGAALATVTGEPLAADGAVARVLEVVLAIYSVVVFATLAGALGAFFLQKRGSGAAPGRFGRDGR
jgi:voltage-gated potassium channel